jgi:hypothetical protein
VLPIVHGLERKYGDRIDFLRLSIHNPATFALQKQLGFTVTPEFFLLDANGAVLAHWDDGFSVEGVEQVFAGLLNED